MRSLGPGIAENTESFKYNLESIDGEAPTGSITIIHAENYEGYGPMAVSFVDETTIDLAVSAAPPSSGTTDAFASESSEDSSTTEIVDPAESVDPATVGSGVYWVARDLDGVL